MVDALQAAVIRQRRVRLEYANRTRQRSERVVDPWGLADKDDVDRIVEATVTDESARRPADFDLSRAWGEGSSTWRRSDRRARPAAAARRAGADRD
jgi:predicted DNA-binding transcriptional regulator YafY